MTIFLKKTLRYMRSEEFRRAVYLFIACTFVNYNLCYTLKYRKKINDFCVNFDPVVSTSWSSLKP